MSDLFTEEFMSSETETQEKKPNDNINEGEDLCECKGTQHGYYKDEEGYEYMTAREEGDNVVLTTCKSCYIYL